MLQFWKSSPSETGDAPPTSKKGVVSNAGPEVAEGVKASDASDHVQKDIAKADIEVDTPRQQGEPAPQNGGAKATDAPKSISEVHDLPPKVDAEVQPTAVTTTTTPPRDEAGQAQPEQQAFPSLTANAEDNTPSSAGPDHRSRRTSFRSFAFFYGRNKPSSKSAHKAESTTSPSPVTVIKNESKPAQQKKPQVSKQDQRATSYAYYVRSLIVGLPLPSIPLPSSSSKPSFMRKKRPPQPLKKLKSELLIPDEANRVIAQLRTLPTPDTSKGVIHGTIKRKDGKLEETEIDLIPRGVTPIHAVCLDCTDEEADTYHFSQLSSKPIDGGNSAATKSAQGGESRPSDDDDVPPNLASADITSVIPVLRDLKLIDLVAGPAGDFGLGQPVGSPGIFAGSVPSSGTLADGLVQVGQQLLNLGFATTTAVLPNHAGIHPPLDRLSVLTYWWGYELVIPPPSMKYLADVKSISNSLLNFLTAFSLFNSGVREILPFIRYASQFIDYEWNTIKAQDKGKGVVCAATWVMPAALVPRPWDFENSAEGSKNGRPFAAFGSLASGAPLPPPLPGTEVLIQPLQPSINGPDAPLIPVVTVTPPMAPLAIEDADGLGNDK